MESASALNSPRDFNKVICNISNKTFKKYSPKYMTKRKKIFLHIEIIFEYDLDKTLKNISIDDDFLNNLPSF